MLLFHQATGLAIRLVDPELAMLNGEVCGHEHGFCRESGMLGSAVCHETRSTLRRKVRANLAPVAHTCATGLTEVAVPLVVNRKHLGTFLIGQTLCAKPSARSWAQLVKSVDGVVESKKLHPLRAQYLKGQVVDAAALKPLVQMVALHSQRLTQNLKPVAGKPAKKRAAKRPAKKR